MIRSSDLYIDLGTANTLVYARGKGFLLNEPSVIALRKRGAHGEEVFGVGHEAKRMCGRNPENVIIRKPLNEGVIADFQNTARMLKAFVAKIKDNAFMYRPRMIISLPCRVTQHEKNAVKDLGFELGASEVHLLDEPMAAAIGSGLSVLAHKGHMVVDIGGGTTEIAIISLGGIVAATAVRVGGDHIDQAIMEHLRNDFNFMVGEQTAEKIKIGVGRVLQDQNVSMEVGGFDAMMGLPRKFKVDTQMVYKAVDRVATEIVISVREAIELAPPEISGDLAESGIVLTGGGALLGGLAERIKMEIGVPVTIAENPLLSVAMGGAMTLEDSELFEGIERPA